MKSTKRIATLFLLFISTTLFAQKVHYKDSYYTIVKSKIFHRGYDVYGQLTPGKIDTIHTIAQELYNEKGKLKEKYKKRKKRDRYKLPEGFWEQKNGIVAEATNINENKATATTAVISEAENQTKTSGETAVTETNVLTTNTAPIITQEKIIEKVQKEEVTEPKKATKIAANKKADKEAVAEPKKEKVSKHKNEEEKPVKIPKEDTTKSKNAEIVKENRALEQEEKSVHKDEKKAVMKEKITQQKEEKEEKIAELKNKQEKRTKTHKEEAAEHKDKKEKTAAIKKAKISDSSELKEQEKKEEKSLVKEKRDVKKSAEKTKQKQSQEAEKLEETRKNLQKEKKANSKKQKSLEAKGVALASVSLVSTSVANNDTYGTIYIKINKEKTSATKSGAVLLFFDMINNSDKDLVILKPNNTMDSRLDFFMNIMECEDVPIIATDYIAKELKIKEEDYLTIPANAKIELFVNGTHRNWLACSSEDIILQLQYNPFKNAEEGIELQPTFKKQLSKSLKRVTPIKIESENIKFKLNKQE